MKKINVATRTCDDEANSIGQAYADLLKEGFKVEHVFATYERGRGPKVIMIGTKEAEQAQQERIDGQ